MPQHNPTAAHGRAEALFKRRAEQKADAPVAMAEYRAAEQAKYERMHELKALRLARDARLAREAKTPRRSAARSTLDEVAMRIAARRVDPRRGA